jgi:hypothetical protein
MSPSVFAFAAVLPRRLSRVRRSDPLKTLGFGASRLRRIEPPQRLCAHHWRQQALDSSPIRWIIASPDSPAPGHAEDSVGDETSPDVSLCLPQADSSTVEGPEPQPPLHASLTDTVLRSVGLPLLRVGLS